MPAGRAGERQVSYVFVLQVMVLAAGLFCACRFIDGLPACFPAECWLVRVLSVFYRLVCCCARLGVIHNRTWRVCLPHHVCFVSFRTFSGHRSIYSLVDYSFRKVYELKINFNN